MPAGQADDTIVLSIAGTGSVLIEPRIPSAYFSISWNSAMTAKKVLYTAKVHTIGARDGGTSRSDDGRLDILHSLPGSKGSGTNPEQLFAAGWSACFDGALGLAARALKVELPADVAIDAEVDLCLEGDAYFLRARLNVSLPGLERHVALALIERAHQTCPYSKAVRGNIDVVLNLA
jgi:osmotically inducible protein OsmC